MKRWLVLVLGSIITVGLIGIGSPAASSNGHKILQFQTMVGVDGPFVGSVNPIRGINGGGLPWQIDDAAGKLSSSGNLEVRVRGLVLLDGPPVPEALRGTNPAANFRAIVSCTTTIGGAAAPWSSRRCGSRWSRMTRGSARSSRSSTRTFSSIH